MRTLIAAIVLALAGPAVAEPQHDNHHAATAPHPTNTPRMPPMFAPRSEARQARPVGPHAEARVSPERWHGQTADRERDRDREHDRDDWNRGRWYQGEHGGHAGWWWIVGDTWFPYGEPVEGVPSATAPYGYDASGMYWYWCVSANAYYPYVSTCPEGWRTVDAEPPAP